MIAKHSSHAVTAQHNAPPNLCGQQQRRSGGLVMRGNGPPRMACWCSLYCELQPALITPI